jgi:hypothetical protein
MRSLSYEVEFLQGRSCAADNGWKQNHFFDVRDLSIDVNNVAVRTTRRTVECFNAVDLEKTAIYGRFMSSLY